MNRAAPFLLLVAASCATYRPGHLVASDSSGDSGNSSAQSGQSSQGSADSSKSSNDSSKSSNDSSKSSSNSNESSQTKNESSAGSTKQSTGPLLSTTVLGATVASVGVTIWGLPGKRASLDEQKEAAYAFVRAASLDIEADLAVGEGRFLEDVAAAAEISKAHFRTFAATLRAHRTELLALADDASLTPERAVTFLQRIGTIARAEPTLAGDAARFAAAHGDEG